jgi:hypothetical protein
MTTFSFESKLDRADQHLHALERKIDRWRAGHPYGIVDDIDPETLENVVRLKPTRSIPPTLPLLIGECLYNLRSALDHLVQELAFYKDRLRLPGLSITIRFRPYFDDTQFPICCNEGQFTSKGARDIGRIAPGAQTIIESLQPYHALDLSTHWLWLLDELSNMDKHRAINVAIGVQSGVSLIPPPKTIIKSFQFWGPLGRFQGEAEILRYIAVSMIDQTTRVKVNSDPAAHIAFAEFPAEGREVLATLIGIRTYIREEVIPRLTPYL